MVCKKGDPSVSRCKEAGSTEEKEDIERDGTVQIAGHSNNQNLYAPDGGTEKTKYIPMCKSGGVGKY